MPYAAAGRPILFCEPSCLSAVREDAPALVRGETRTRAEAVARVSVLFEEFARTIVAAAHVLVSAPRRSCCMGTVTRNRWGWCRRRNHCCR